MLLLPTAVLATQTDVVKNTTTGATYPDLASAVNAASSGETLQLLSNVTLDSRLNINKSLTLDLADHTLTGGNNVKDYVIIAIGNGINGTLTNGTCTASYSSCSAIRASDGAHVEIVDAHVSFADMNALEARDGSSITLRGNTHIKMTGNMLSYGTIYIDNSALTIEDNSVVVEGGSGIILYGASNLNMKGGELRCNASSLATIGGKSAGSTATITGGSLRSDGGTAIYWSSGDSLTIGGDAAVEGLVALSLRSGTFTLQDNATLIGTGSGRVASPNVGSTPDDGSALRVDAQLYNGSPIVVNLEGGTLESKYGRAITLYRSAVNEVPAQVTLDGTQLKGPVAFYASDVTYEPGVTFEAGKLEATSGNTGLTLGQSAAGAAAAMRNIQDADGNTIPSLIFYSTLSDALAGGAGDVYVLSDSGLTALTLTDPAVRLIAAPGVKLDVTGEGDYGLASTTNADGSITYSLIQIPPFTVTVSLTDGTLTATTTPVENATFTYNWYCDGFCLSSGVSNTFTNLPREGDYYVEVQYTVPLSTGGTLTSPVVRSNSVHFSPLPAPTPIPDTSPIPDKTTISDTTTILDTTPAPSLTLPQTGDSTHLALYVLLAILSLAVLATLLVRRHCHG